MFRPESDCAFRPVVSSNDWQLIIKALAAYSHHRDYQNLLERLEKQAAAAGPNFQSRSLLRG